MSIIYKPTRGPECWQDFLADPEKHWKTGFSAKSMAYAWDTYKGLPKRVSDALSAISDKIEPLLVIPEYKVPMPGEGGASQNDAFLLARVGDQTAAIMIEGKVNESFGPTLKEWLKNASDNKLFRLNAIYETLGLSGDQSPALRYQLFHRTASAVLMATRFKTDLAIMLVHSFSQDHVWFDDYARFAQTLGIIEPVRGKAQESTTQTAMLLYLGWVTGEARFLEM